MKLGNAMQVGLGPGHTVLHVDPASLTGRSTAAMHIRKLRAHALPAGPYNPRSVSIVAKQLDGSR